MLRRMPIRPSLNPFANDPVSTSAPMLDASATQSGASEAQLRTDITLHARSLWGQLILKVAREQRKENNQ